MLLKVVFESPLSLFFLQVRQFAMDLQVQVFEGLATHASRMCSH